MMQFNVIVEDVNSKKFIPYDIMPYLAECWKKEKNKPQTFGKFKTFIKKSQQVSMVGKM